MDGVPPTRIYELDMESAGDLRALTNGPNSDRSARYSPDGARVAFLSDREQPGNFQLYLLNRSDGELFAAPPVEGWVEYLQWSPDGTRILLGAAGHGADVAGGQGAVASQQQTRAIPSWVPELDTGAESYRWRSVWIYDLPANTTERVSGVNANVWEASWCGPDRIALLASAGPQEGLWYEARLHLLDVTSRELRKIYTPQDQLGCLCASPDGLRIAAVDAVCSDRGIVAGDLVIVSPEGGRKRVNTQGVDISCAEWRSDKHVLLAGHEGFDTVVGVYDVDADRFTETWRSRELTTGGFYATVAGIGVDGDCVLAAESFTQSPEIGAIRRGRYERLKSFELGYVAHAAAIGAVEARSWPSTDGLAIQGWLLRPLAAGPHPVVMFVHGGPVWSWRPFWLGRRAAAMLLLVAAGYAVFLPNPRGSGGRGRDFARAVVGDMGGADTQDFLSGLDYLVEEGIADPKRLGVTGLSYGGFMASWLITQDDRFAAAVPAAPVSNHVTDHLLGNIPQFVSMFLADRYDNPSGKYFERSPIMHAHKTKTPTLNICGALDRCTPPEEAAQFHSVLRLNGVKSALLTYPEEGHGVRKFPAAIDYAARVAGWFHEHMPP